MTKHLFCSSVCSHNTELKGLVGGLGYRVKTAEQGPLQGCHYGEIVQIVRGEKSFTISKYELEDFIAVLCQLRKGAGDLSKPSDVSTDVDAPDTEKVRVWRSIENFISSCQRAQGKNSIMRQVKRDRVVDGDPTDLVEAVLVERVASKDVIKTGSGRYSMNVRERSNVATQSTLLPTPEIPVEEVETPASIPAESSAGKEKEPSPVRALRSVPTEQDKIWEAIRSYLTAHAEKPQQEGNLWRAVRRDCGPGTSYQLFKTVLADRIRSKHLTAVGKDGYTLSQSAIAEEQVA